MGRGNDACRDWDPEAPLSLKGLLHMPESIKKAMYKPMASWKDEGVPLKEVVDFFLVFFFFLVVNVIIIIIIIILIFSMVYADGSFWEFCAQDVCDEVYHEVFIISYSKDFLNNTILLWVDRLLI